MPVLKYSLVCLAYIYFNSVIFPLSKDFISKLCYPSRWPSQYFLFPNQIHWEEMSHCVFWRLEKLAGKLS